MGAAAVRLAHDRFGRLRAYLAGLPAGLDSHPQCLTKSALARSLVAAALVDAADELPPALAGLLCAPPPVTAWIPQVHANALVIAARDLLFDSDAALARHCYRAQRELFASPLYALLMRCASPQRVFVSAERRWTAFNRGCEVRSESDGDGGRIWLEHPPGLLEVNTRLALAEALRATLEMSRARRAEVRTAAIDATTTRFDAAW